MDRAPAATARITPAAQGIATTAKRVPAFQRPANLECTEADREQIVKKYSGRHPYTWDEYTEEVAIWKALKEWAGSPEEARLARIVENLCIGSGLPRPRLRPSGAHRP